MSLGMSGTFARYWEIDGMGVLVFARFLFCQWNSNVARREGKCDENI